MSKIILTGDRPTGKLHVGHYVGSLRRRVELQNSGEFDKIFIMIADAQALTDNADNPQKIRDNIIEVALDYMACGLDEQKNTLFVQSQVPAHAELGWMLDCYTMFGELSRMTQFKDKSAKNAQNINAGLFTYPALMAADILLYQTDVVPVGIDQKQHLEIARDIATRFNNIYGDIFTIPEPYIPKTGARVMSLQDPAKKMSKSDENANAWVAILDSKDDIIRKFKRAVTDSEAAVRFREEQPGISNLITIYSAVTGKTTDEIEKEFEGKGYGDFKLAVGETVADTLAPIKQRYDEIIKDKKALEQLYTEGAMKAEYVAKKTYFKAMKKVGFVL